jgi:hypothetical protein
MIARLPSQVATRERKSMQVGESSLKTLIEGQKQFQVPLYQRQYAWGDSQLSQLWDDVREQYDLLTPDENGEVAASPPTHFLGSMVLAPCPMTSAHGVTPFIIIDGQQRMTSLLVALCALRDHAARQDESRGKTATARRWVAVPDWLITDVAETCPPDDRTPERRVFQGFTPDVAKNVMARARKAPGSHTSIPTI